MEKIMHVLDRQGEEGQQVPPFQFGGGRGLDVRVEGKRKGKGSDKYVSFPPFQL